MERFNYYEFVALQREGKEPKVVTRSGQSVRILGDMLYNEAYPIAAAVRAVKDTKESEFVVSVSRDGRNTPYDGCYDLFFAPITVVRWGLYSKDSGLILDTLYDCEQDAINAKGAIKDVETTIVKLTREE